MPRHLQILSTRYLKKAGSTCAPSPSLEDLAKQMLSKSEPLMNMGSKPKWTTRRCEGKKHSTLWLRTWLGRRTPPKIRRSVDFPCARPPMRNTRLPWFMLSDPFICNAWPVDLSKNCCLRLPSGWTLSSIGKMSTSLQSSEAASEPASERACRSSSRYTIVFLLFWSCHSLRWGRLVFWLNRNVRRLRLGRVPLIFRVFQ
mmetsp:Transcript_4072/g.11051  ORF Transcript_4072/g.11051 Transcript_4072/m.11051 type:complete len:200 (-) Transcript_4072:853-1452(-)